MVLVGHEFKESGKNISDLDSGFDKVYSTTVPYSYSGSI